MRKNQSVLQCQLRDAISEPQLGVLKYETLSSLSGFGTESTVK